jgi:hypothetical protein
MEAMETAVEQPVESVEQPSDGHVESTSTEEADPYTPKESKAYVDYLKSLRDSGDPQAAKYARLAKDNHSHMYQLKQLEPSGLNGVKEKYALLDSVTHGELKGVEAIGAIQDQLATVAAFDERVTQGDLGALDDLSEEMQQGVMKMVPGLLDRMAEQAPEEYGKAILPHLYNSLISSPLASHFNGLIDALQEKPPSWLPEDRKPAWAADQMQRITGRVSSMYQWFETQRKAVEDAKQPQSVPRGTNGAAKQPTEADKANQELQQAHWTTKIQPGLDKHAESRFSELFRPYSQRLKLDQNASADLKQAFTQGVVRKAMANPVYKSQIERYHGQRNPDPATVVNLAKVEFDKHAKSVLESLVKQRYNSFLNGKGKPTPPAGQNGAAKPAGPVGVKEFVVSVRPQDSDINFKHPDFPAMRAQGKFPLRDGRVAVLRK